MDADIKAVVAAARDAIAFAVLGKGCGCTEGGDEEESIGCDVHVGLVIVVFVLLV